MTPLALRRASPIGLTLFLCLFAGQAAVIAISPVLTEVASDFDVSTATAGQLRSVSGFAAGLAAVAMGTLVSRVGLRNLLVLGLGILATGSLLSAAAPTFAILVAAQVAVGAGLAIVLSGGVAAAAAWSADAERARVLSWTLVGQPGAWIVGMPVIGVVGGASWRLAWLAVPFAASLLALLAVATRPADQPTEPGSGTLQVLRHNRAVAGWALGELLAFSAWAGTLVFAGALFVESYDASPAAAGLVLGLAAIAYLPGNFLARRWTGAAARRALVLLPIASAGLVAVFGDYRPALWASALLLGLLAFAGGARTIVGSAYGLEVCARRRVFAMRLRAAASQFGYLVGAAAGGVALAAGGYSALGLAFAALFALAALPHILSLVGGSAPPVAPAADEELLQVAEVAAC
jgi:predicted MFS family arabinose efflux permease